MGFVLLLFAFYFVSLVHCDENGIQNNSDVIFTSTTPPSYLPCPTNSSRYLCSWEIEGPLPLREYQKDRDSVWMCIRGKLYIRFVCEGSYSCVLDESKRACRLKSDESNKDPRVEIDSTINQISRVEPRESTAEISQMNRTQMDLKTACPPDMTGERCCWEMSEVLSFDKNAVNMSFKIKQDILGCENGKLIRVAYCGEGECVVSMNGRICMSTERKRGMGDLYLNADDISSGTTENAQEYSTVGDSGSSEAATEISGISTMHEPRLPSSTQRYKILFKETLTNISTEVLANISYTTENTFAAAIPSVLSTEFAQIYLDGPVTTTTKIIERLNVEFEDLSEFSAETTPSVREEFSISPSILGSDSGHSKLLADYNSKPDEDKIRTALRYDVGILSDASLKANEAESQYSKNGSLREMNNATKVNILKQSDTESADSEELIGRSINESEIAAAYAMPLKSYVKREAQMTSNYANGEFEESELKYQNQFFPQQDLSTLIHPKKQVEDPEVDGILIQTQIPTSTTAIPEVTVSKVRGPIESYEASEYMQLPVKRVIESNNEIHVNPSRVSTSGDANENKKTEHFSVNHSTMENSVKLSTPNYIIPTSTSSSVELNENTRGKFITEPEFTTENPAKSQKQQLEDLKRNEKELIQFASSMKNMSGDLSSLGAELDDDGESVKQDRKLILAMKRNQTDEIKNTRINATIQTRDDNDTRIVVNKTLTEPKLGFGYDDFFSGSYQSAERITLGNLDIGNKEIIQNNADKKLNNSAGLRSHSNNKSTLHQANTNNSRIHKDSTVEFETEDTESEEVFETYELTQENVTRIHKKPIPSEGANVNRNTSSNNPGNSVEPQQSNPNTKPTPTESQLKTQEGSSLTSAQSQTQDTFINSQSQPTSNTGPTNTKPAVGTDTANEPTYPNQDQTSGKSQAQGNNFGNFHHFRHRNVESSPTQKPITNSAPDFPPIRNNFQHNSKPEYTQPPNIQGEDDYNAYEQWEEPDRRFGKDPGRTSFYPQQTPINNNNNAPISEPQLHRTSVEMEIVETQSAEDYEVYEVREEKTTHILRNVARGPNQH